MKRVSLQKRRLMEQRKPKLSDRKQDLLNRIIMLENERDNLGSRLSDLWEIVNNFRIAAEPLISDLTIEASEIWIKYETLIKEFIARTEGKA